MRKTLLLACLLTGLLFTGNVSAQLSTNPNKFLGNITTRYNVDTDGFKYTDLWNQITPENESKWGSIEGNARGSFNWGSDNAYNYAKQHNIPFKFHCLIWGAQYPNWINSLSKAEQYKAIEEWMDAVAARYPDLPLIDVVNEAVPGHQPAPYKEALGGDGVTGYDWIVKAFEMAHERWPDAILIYNDYNTFQWQKNEFINLVQTLIDAGAPIDAYGCQSHDLTDMSVSNFKQAMTDIQKALQLPMYSTEYDIGTADDNLQLQRYKEQIPYMWESDYCAGITLWGFIYGATWTTDGNSGIIRDGKDRPAMKWLREYMASDKAKNAGLRKNFPLTNGHTKEASVYVTPSTIKASIGDTVTINVRARMRTKTIDHVDLYIDNVLKASMTEAPYITEYVGTTANKKVTLKAIVYTTDGSEYTRYSHITTYPPRKPFNDTVLQLPGTLQAENFDGGADGISFHDSDNVDEGNVGYRKDNGGVDIVTGNKGYAIGYTANGEWLEYTVDVNQAGVYLYNAHVSSGTTGSGFSVSIKQNGEWVDLANISVPQTGSSNWDTYKVVEGRCAVPLEKGRAVMRITITGQQCNIDKLELFPLETTDRVLLDIKADPDELTAGSPTTIKVTPTILPDTIKTATGEKIETVTIKSVSIYVNDKFFKTLTTAPYEAVFTETNASGLFTVKAMAVDSKRRETPFFEGSFYVRRGRMPYNGEIAVPGIIQFENFDVQGEMMSFHDSDDIDQGGHCYRNDNEGLDIITENGDTYVGYTVAGEWMEYSMNVKKTDTYKFDAKVRASEANAGFSILDAETMTEIARLDIPESDGEWLTLSGDIGTLEAGAHKFRVVITGSGCDLNLMRISKGSTSVEEVSSVDSYQVYSITGVYVGLVEAADDASLDNAIINKVGRSGIYLVKSQKTGKTQRHLVE